MRKNSIPSLVLLSLVGVVIALYYFLNHTLSIKETPTCVRYEFDMNAGSVSNAMDDTRKFFVENDIKEFASRSDSHIWDSPSVRVSWDVSPSQKSATVFVCANENKSRDWQRVARGIEKVLMPIASFKTVGIQLDSSVYHCNPVCQIAVKAPVDFETLNRTSLAFPKER